jgi:hypothetical protein
MAIVYRPQNLRILSLPRRKLRRPWGGDSPSPPPVVTYRVKAENGETLTAENGFAIRTEQN